MRLKENISSGAEPGFKGKGAKNLGAPFFKIPKIIVIEKNKQISSATLDIREQVCIYEKYKYIQNFNISL